jgi:hypothetical protein
MHEVLVHADDPVMGGQWIARFPALSVQIGGYRAAHPNPFDTLRNASRGNALRQPRRRDEHGRRPDLAGKRQLVSGRISSPGSAASPRSSLDAEQGASATMFA